MGKKYKVESEFEDLHGNPDDSELDLDVDLSDSDNPIIKAAIGGKDEDWQPPVGDEDDDGEDDEEDDEEDDGEEVDDEDDSDEDEDPDEEDSDEDEEDSEDDEDDKYSRKVQKRIDRERELRRQEKEAADRRIRKMEKKLELRDAKDNQRDKERKLEEKLSGLRAKKREAIEEGDTDAQIEIDDQILDIRSEIKTGQANIENLEKSLKSETEDQETAAGATPPAGQKWLERYPEFHANPRFRDAVLNADKTVAAMGFDKNTDAYYSKIEEIVAVSFPKVVKKRKVKVTKRKKGGKRKIPAVSGTQRAGTRRATSRSRKKRGVIRLTKADQANMRIFGMDPANAEHAKAYAESKED